MKQIIIIHNIIIIIMVMFWWWHLVQPLSFRYSIFFPVLLYYNEKKREFILDSIAVCACVCVFFVSTNNILSILDALYIYLSMKWIVECLCVCVSIKKNHHHRDGHKVGHLCPCYCWWWVWVWIFDGHDYDYWWWWWWWWLNHKLWHSVGFFYVCMFHIWIFE